MFMTNFFMNIFLYNCIVGSGFGHCNSDSDTQHTANCFFFFIHTYSVVRLTCSGALHDEISHVGQLNLHDPRILPLGYLARIHLLHSTVDRTK